MSWKVTLKNGEVIYNSDFHRLEQFDRHWNFKKKVISKEKITVGYFWWKKEVEEIEETFETLLCIPIENILKTEQVKDS